MRPPLLRVSNGLPKEIRIEREDAGFVVADCESLNGTFVNRKTVTRAALKHGDEILVGQPLLLPREEEPAFQAPEVCMISQLKLREQLENTRARRQNQ